MSDLPDLEDISVKGTDTAAVDESCRLHGPPGCGKTTQSAARVATLIRDHGYTLTDVTWATYRRSLAVDTLNRLAEWDVIDSDQLENPSEGPTRYIATTHAVANRLMPNLPDPAGRGDRIDFCKKRGLQFTTKQPWTDGIGEMIFDGFSWLKTNRLDPGDAGDVRKWNGYHDLRDRWNGDMCSVWRDWESYKAQRDLIDYYEMLERPLEQGVAPAGDILVVDEYHDATPLMAELSEMWAEHAEIVIVAGDPHQVVNAYDGADPEFFDRLEYPKVLLDRTYRVPEQIWRLATAVLSNAHTPPPVTRVDEGYIDEYLSPGFEYDHGGREWTTPDPDATAGPVDMFRRYSGSTLYLTRTRMQADGVCHALDKAGVVYTSQSELPGWNADSTRLQIHNALQTLSGFGPGDFSSAGGLSKYQSSSQDPRATELQVDTAALLLAHTGAEYLAQDRTDTREQMNDLRATSEYVTLEELDALVEADFWSAYTAGASSLGRLNKTGTGVASTEISDRDKQALGAALERHENPIDAAHIGTEVLTVHASKGKGADNVVLYDGTSPRAAEEMRAKRRTMQNEYRTWYVGLTRASERLCVMRSAFDWTVPILPDNLAAAVSGSPATSVGNSAAD